MDEFKLSDMRPRKMTNIEIATAESLLRRERGQKSLYYRGWKVTRGPMGSFRFFVQNHENVLCWATYGRLHEALDGIENAIAQAN